MPSPLSVDLRKRVVAAVAAGASCRRTKVAITTPRRWRDAVPSMTAPGSAELPARREQLPGSKVLAWIMTAAPDRLSPADNALLARIVQDPDAAYASGESRLVRRGLLPDV